MWFSAVLLSSYVSEPVFPCFFFDDTLCKVLTVLCISDKASNAILTKCRNKPIMQCGCIGNGTGLQMRFSEKGFSNTENGSVMDLPCGILIRV